MPITKAIIVSDDFPSVPNKLTKQDRQMMVEAYQRDRKAQLQAVIKGRAMDVTARVYEYGSTRFAEGVRQMNDRAREQEHDHDRTAVQAHVDEAMVAFHRRIRNYEEMAADDIELQMIILSQRYSR